MVLSREKNYHRIPDECKAIFVVGRFYKRPYQGIRVTILLALLCGGKNPGKPFKELNFDELCDLFPEIRGCDVLLLDCAGIKLEPQKDITIIDMNPEIVDRKHARLFRLMREEAGYTLKRERKKE